MQELWCENNLFCHLPRNALNAFKQLKRVQKYLAQINYLLRKSRARLTFFSDLLTLAKIRNWYFVNRSACHVDVYNALVVCKCKMYRGNAVSCVQITRSPLCCIEERQFTEITHVVRFSNQSFIYYHIPTVFICCRRYLSQACRETR